MTDTTERDLLAAIRTNPECDTTRLVYADWLDGIDAKWKECPACKGKCTQLRGGRGNGDRFMPFLEVTCPTCNGSGSVPDTDARDRAEFVRVQVESNRIRGGGCAVVLGCECDGTKEWCIRCRLIARESALLAAHPEWRPKCPVRIGTWDHQQCPACNGVQHIGEFRRGFLECVRVPTLETVLSNECPQCRGSNAITYNSPVSPCQLCKGTTETTWHPTAWVRDELARFLPHVREVWCEDQTPTLDEGGYEWYGLPDCLNVPLTKGTFSTADAANTAMARAVADELRSVLTGK